MIEFDIHLKLKNMMCDNKLITSRGTHPFSP